MGLLIGIGRSIPEFPYDHYYGIEWDVTVSNPKCTRIGKSELHQSLPIQSLMRRCVLRDSGSIAYYLNATDSSKKADGLPANLSGADGQVMVDIPDFYVRFEEEGDKRRCLISQYDLPGFRLWNRCFVSAYEATIHRPTNKLSSVVNTTPDYRGGDNDASKDGHFNTQIGRPASMFSLDEARLFARNRGSASWNCYAYEVHKRLFWLFAVEYATFNSQDDFNAQPSTEGYKQGGLGIGVTNLTGWDSLFDTYPVVPCGITNRLGNRTGIMQYGCIKADDGSIYQTLSVPSYRGVENPFGHIWKLTDGAKAIIYPSSAGRASEFYVCRDKEKWEAGGLTDYELRGVIPQTSGHIREVILSEDGETMPLKIGAGSTSYFCDDFSTSDTDTNALFSERILLTCCHAASGFTGGLSTTHVRWIRSSKGKAVGSRLCFIP